MMKEAHQSCHEKENSYALSMRVLDSFSQEGNVPNVIFSLRGVAATNGWALLGCAPMFRPTCYPRWRPRPVETASFNRIRRIKNQDIAGRFGAKPGGHSSDNVLQDGRNRYSQGHHY